jgi:uncharacterized protein (DUF58 family)
MVPTPLGVKALGFYGLCWFAFTATPYTNLFFFLILFQSLLLVLGLALPPSYLRGVQVRFPQGVIGLAGESLSFEILWETPSKARAIDLWGFGIKAVPRGKKRIASLGRGGDAQKSIVHLPGQLRGILHLSRFRLRTSYPLGLFRAHKTVLQELEIWILPKPIPHSLETSIGNSPSSGEEGEASILSEIGQEMAGVREFRSGDDPTRIYWKKTAQRGVLVLKEGLEPPAQRKELFVLDETQEEEAFERQLEALAFLGQKLRREKGSLTLRCLAGEQQFGSKGQNWKELDHFLVHAQAMGASDGE